VFFNNFVPTPNTFGMANLLIIFGQFVDHDITLIDLVAESRIVTGAGSIPQMTFPLSERVGEDAAIDNPMFSNAISAYLDLTQVYGGDVERNIALRATTGGRMRSQIVDGQEFLPINANLPAPVSMAMGNIPQTFAAGDIRANEQVILTAFHTLFLREHNRMADIFTAQGMNNDDAFNAARNGNIAQYQNIVFNEFLPGLLGSDMLPPYDGYDDSINAEVTLEFSTAMYRLGHSGVANNVLAVDSKAKSRSVLWPMCSSPRKRFWIPMMPSEPCCSEPNKRVTNAWTLRCRTVFAVCCSQMCWMKLPTWVHSMLSARVTISWLRTTMSAPRSVSRSQP